MSPIHLRNLGIPSNQPEDRQGRFREPQTRGLEGYGSSSSTPPTPQISIPMEHGQQKIQPSFTLRRTGRILPEGMSQRDTLQRS
ncbi:hypothetical protein O181_032275 [Austropuccinia psidii MF-1]|uniref:Uncharacterized protein n=1 Tax=Austropuccinia psidii MF-1 TaxID=1389203 RepID=A0A9Q3D0Q7_9BASI|nr:hypothetical protein [Austropuccinia psidii MF-1]